MSKDNYWRLEALNIISSLIVASKETDDVSILKSVLLYVADVLAEYMKLASELVRERTLFREALKRCAVHLGPEAYLSDDGSTRKDLDPHRVLELMEKKLKKVENFFRTRIRFV